MSGEYPRPSKWVSPSGKVHRRRLRFFVGTTFERRADPDVVITLCGQLNLNVPAPKGAAVTCGVCTKSSNTKAHLRCTSPGGVVRT